MSYDQRSVATGLRRPSLEHFNNGAEVFIAATIEGGTVSMLYGDPGIGVMIGREGSVRSVTTVPLNTVTIASGYANADDLQCATSRLSVAEEKIAAIKGLAETNTLDVAAVMAIIEPPDDPIPEDEQ